MFMTRPIRTALCFASLMVAGISSRLIAQSYTETNEDGPLAPALAPGTPASSYALSGLDNVNYFNGNLNVHIPVLPLGGRGAAGHLIYGPIERHWSVAKNYDNDTGLTSYAPETFLSSGLLTGSYTSGFVTVETSSGQPNRCIITDSNGKHYAGLGPFLTWLVWHSPDGSETVLVDAMFNGQPQNASINTCTKLSTYQPADRGKVFRSYDGQYLTFVADNDVLDGSGQVTGTLLSRDGTQYRIGSGSSYVSQIEDRNGNRLTYTFQLNATGGVYTVNDSAGRTESITITEDPQDNSQDVIVYPGTGGTQRTVYVNYSQLQNVLR